MGINENPKFRGGGSLDDLLEGHFLGGSDVSAAIQESFRDGFEEETDRRVIDQKTDLTDMQISNLAVADFLVAKGLFANLDVLTHSVKRLSVSRNRKGRVEMVELAKGVNERKMSSGVFGKLFGSRAPPM